MAFSMGFIGIRRVQGDFSDEVPVCAAVPAVSDEDKI
jgi:hypothetical protein